MSAELRYARFMTNDPALIEITQLCPGLPVVSADLQPVYADLMSWAATVLMVRWFLPLLRGAPSWAKVRRVGPKFVRSFKLR